jgi:hypothetical protein
MMTLLVEVRSGKMLSFFEKNKEWFDRLGALAFTGVLLFGVVLAPTGLQNVHAIGVLISIGLCLALNLILRSPTVQMLIANSTNQRRANAIATVLFIATLMGFLAVIWTKVYTG